MNQNRFFIILGIAALIVATYLLANAVGPEVSAVSISDSPVGMGELRLQEASQASALLPVGMGNLRRLEASQSSAISPVGMGELRRLESEQTKSTTEGSGLSPQAIEAWAARYAGQAESPIGISPSDQLEQQAWAGLYVGENLPYRSAAPAELLTSNSGLSPQALAAWSARYAGQAKSLGGGLSQKAIDAWSARYAGQAKPLSRGPSPEVLDAWAARYAGQAKPLSRGPSPEVLDAWAARYASQAKSLGSGLSQKAIDAWSARYEGLAEEELNAGSSLSPEALDAWAARYEGQAQALLSITAKDKQELEAWAGIYIGENLNLRGSITPLPLAAWEVRFGDLHYSGR